MLKALMILLSAFYLSACNSGGGLFLRGNYCKDEQTQKTDIEDKDNDTFKKASLEVEDLPNGEYVFDSSEMFVESEDGSFKIMGQKKLVRGQVQSNLGCVRGDKGTGHSYDFSINGIEKFVKNEGGKVLIDVSNYRIYSTGKVDDFIHFDVSDAQKSSAAKPSDVFEAEGQQAFFYQGKEDTNLYQVRSLQEQEDGVKVMLTVQFKRVEN